MRATIRGNTDGVYVDSRTNEAHIDPRKASNYNEVNMDGVSHITVVRLCRTWGIELRIVQASGYTCDRGLFCDVY